MQLSSWHLFWCSYLFSSLILTRLYLAARLSWDSSRSHPCLLGGSEDPWLSVFVFRRIWLFQIRSLVEYLQFSSRRHSKCPMGSRVVLPFRLPPANVRLNSHLRQDGRRVEIPGLNQAICANCKSSITPQATAARPTRSDGLDVRLPCLV